MSTTSIGWATHVLNAFTGCDRVSPGCAHCYAAEIAASNQKKELGRARVALEQGQAPPTLRYQNDGDPKTSGPGFGFTVHWDKLRGRGPFPSGARVFVNSMSDVFHEKAPLRAIAALWALFAARPDVNWLVLTKRAERMAYIVSKLVHLGFDEAREHEALVAHAGTPLPNVWLGVSIENRRYVDRADVLRETPAAVRFISAEPLLGPLVPYAVWGDWGDRPPAPLPGLDLTGIDWLIAGGESGRERRPMRREWVQALRDVALESGTSFYFKQGSAFKPDQDRELDGRTWDEIPATATAAAA